MVWNGPKTIAVDFDGVIHTYDKGWQNGEIYGCMMPGAAESLKTLMAKYCVFIHTTRNPKQAANWLGDRGFTVATEDEPDIDETDSFWSTQGTLLVTNRKLVAIAFIDDRAITFTDWPSAMEAVGKLY